jgi:hypothetical protein
MDVGRTNCRPRRRRRRRPGTSKLYWQVGVVFVAEHSSEANKSRDHSCTGRSWPRLCKRQKPGQKNTRKGRPSTATRARWPSIYPRPDSSRLSPSKKAAVHATAGFQIPASSTASRPRDRRPPCNSEMTATSSSLGSGLHSCIVRGAKCGHRHGSAATARSPPAYRLLRTLSALMPADASLELTSLTHS